MKRISKAPATPLAKAFRLHGVVLQKNLTSASSWARLAGNGELVLTLDQSLMALEGRRWVYDNFDVGSRDWEQRTANKARRRLLLEAYRKSGRKVRVIQVAIVPTKKTGVSSIVARYPDFQYWKITKVDPRTGRFRAIRTEIDCDPVPLRFTELDAIKMGWVLIQPFALKGLG